MTGLHAIRLAYLAAVVCFVLGLKLLTGPKTARQGNLISALGMLIAIVATLLHHEVLSYRLIALGAAMGAVVGIVMALRVQMTAMPQMVALLNGFGGLASFLVAYSEYVRHVPERVLARTGPDAAAATAAATAAAPGMQAVVAISLSILIGAVTFTGSLVAFAKLQGLVSSAPLTYRGQQIVNGLLGLLLLGLMAVFCLDPWHPWITTEALGGLAPALVGAGLLSLLLGVLLVIPIGGADMPVVISLLNSYSGLAACATGFILSNELLIVTGSLVGASGIILTSIMCRAMNRSLGNVLFGAFGTGESTGTRTGEKRTVRNYTTDDAAMVLEGASSVIIVPGYGLAVAQAQHITRDLGRRIEEKFGAQVRYAIHPVAGRMPGHMNVLLAEADVPYEKLLAMEDINPDFEHTDVVLVLGANDVVNPIAREKGNPMSGMPILDVDKARTVMIVKRSLSPGFAGIDNPLFYEDKTMMLFGDAKAVVTSLVKAL